MLGEVVPLRATPIASMIRGSIMCGGPRLACLRKEQILALWALLHVLLGIVGYLGLIVPLVDGFVGERLFCSLCGVQDVIPEVRVKV